MSIVRESIQWPGKNIVRNTGKKIQESMGKCRRTGRRNLLVTEIMLKMAYNYVYETFQIRKGCFMYLHILGNPGVTITITFIHYLTSKSSFLVNIHMVWKYPNSQSKDRSRNDSLLYRGQFHFVICLSLNIFYCHYLHILTQNTFIHTKQIRQKGLATSSRNLDSAVPLLNVYDIAVFKRVKEENILIIIFFTEFD